MRDLIEGLFVYVFCVGFLFSIIAITLVIGNKLVNGERTVITTGNEIFYDGPLYGINIVSGGDTTTVREYRFRLIQMGTKKLYSGKDVVVKSGM